MNTHVGIIAPLKNDRKRKTNDTKDEDLYVDCRFILGSVTCEERLLSPCKYNRLIPQVLKL